MGNCGLDTPFDKCYCALCSAVYTYWPESSMKSLTRKQLESRKTRAVRFTGDVVADADRAYEIENDRSKTTPNGGTSKSKIRKVR